MMQYHLFPARADVPSSEFNPVTPRDCRAIKSAQHCVADDGFVPPSLRSMPRREFNYRTKRLYRLRALLDD